MAQQKPLVIDGGQVRQFGTGDQFVIAPWTFPASDGSVNQVLTTDGAGQLSWAPTQLTERASQNLTSVSSTVTTTDGSPVTPITSNGTYTLTSVPTIANGRDGQIIRIINTGAYTVTFQDMGTLGGSNLRLGATTRGLLANRGILELMYDATMGAWIEQFFVNVLAFTPSVSTLTIDGSAAPTREVAAASTADAAPVFVVAYVGVPSAASIDISAGEINASDYPISLTTPYTSLTGVAFNRGSTVGSTVVFTLTATVSSQAGLTKTATITYYNSCYGGTNTQVTALSSAQTVALGVAALNNSKYNGFSCIPSGGYYVWYCHRAALGQVSYFSCNSERAEFTRIGTGTVQVTNAHGFQEAFEQYKSAIAGLGSVTVAALSAAANNRVYLFKSTHTTVGTLTDVEVNAAVQSNLQNTISYAPGTYPVTGAGEYLWYVFPNRLTYTTITFYVGSQVPGGMDGAGTNGDTFTHVNQFGYSETYRAFRSDNPSLGTLSTWSCTGV